MDQRLFAFWRYDQFPHLLGAEILKFEANGKVQVSGFPGFSFSPTKILPYEEGLALWEKLQELESKRDQALAKIRYEYNRRVQDLMGEEHEQEDEEAH